MSKKWNIGIIGAGMVADFHIRAVQHLDNAKLIGLCGSANSANAKQLAQKYNCTYFEDYHALLNDDAIEVVMIATPSGLHEEAVVEAAQKGKHVLCEKPLDITLDRIDNMIRAHKNAGTQLGGIFNYRFTAAVQEIKKAVDAGRLGILTHASVRVPWWRSDSYYESSWRGKLALDGGGALMNQSIHMVDLLQYIAGPIKTVAAFSETLGHNIEAEDTATAIVKFKNNALGAIYGSTASFPGQLRSMEITGTKGTIVLVENDITVWQFAEEKNYDAQIRETYKPAEQKESGSSDPAAIPFVLHANNLAAFLSALTQNNPFEIDGNEARKAVEIILAIYESARQKQFIQL